MESLYKNKFNKFKKELICLAAFSSLFFLFAAGWPLKTEAASLRLDPSEGRYQVDDTIQLDILLDSQNFFINSAQATIYFPTDKLKALEISKKDSIFTLWPQEPFFSNFTGEISFVGGLPSPGFIGKGGKAFSILFLVKKSGNAEIYFGQEKILANDPKGKDLFAFSQKGYYSFFEAGRTFPIKAEDDISPPYPFKIFIDNGGDATNPAPLLYFETKDGGSGMSHYEVKIDEELLRVEVGKTQPWQTPLLPPGIFKVSVRAFDLAGNFTEKSIELKIGPIASPKVTICPVVLNPEKDLFYFGGVSLPSSRVSVFLEKEGKIIKRWVVNSDEEGNWFLTRKVFVNSGLYRISAQTQDSRGAISEKSGICFLRVILSGMVIGSWFLSYQNAGLLMVLLLLLLSAIIFLLLFRAKRSHKKIDYEIKDLKEKFYKEYEELQSDIEKELREMEKISAEREMTEEEKERRERLLKNFNDIKEVLEKELKDIEDIK